MKQIFYKYQGTGNDFVMIDNRHLGFDKKDAKRIALLCDRRFGIGADGLILLEPHKTADFRMVYFNADGREGSMCGNGGRCVVAFAKYLGVITEEAYFEAADGMHRAVIEEDVVRLQMQNVAYVEKHGSHVYLDTGSPHHVQLHADLETLNVKEAGAQIRYGQAYHPDGSNVNFVTKVTDTVFLVRTYERGVEDETLSCGTGVTAVALAMHHIGETPECEVTLNTKGGALKVIFEKDGPGYKNIWLIGPAVQVFKGEI